MLDLYEFFEVEATVNWVEANGFTRVGLQLPDSLLHLSFPLSQLFLPHHKKFKTFVCADSNYGDCCVDQTTALHNDADCIVHYGLSCLSKPTKLPAFLVFADLQAKASFDVSKGKYDLQPLKEFTKVYVEYDVRYDKYARELFRGWCECSPMPPRELIPEETNTADVAVVDYSQYEAVLFVGPSECAQLDRIALQACTTSQVFSFDLTALVNIKANRSLARRFVLVEKCKDAQIIGILVGTMSVSGYKQVIDKLKLEIEESGRKAYLFVFGKLSTAKLGNFPHIDAFVLVACPFHSLVSKSFEFNKPIVTPYELQVALANRPWGNYMWNFAEILAPFDAEDEEEVRFSLNTHQIINKPTAPIGGVKTLSLRYESPAAQSLQRGTFQGLDPHDSRNKPAAKAVPGQVGVASRVFQMSDALQENPH